MKKEKTYRLIPMNMDVYNIDDAIDETKNEGSIIWKNGTTDGKYAQVFNKGDIAYIYCRNLSDGSSRILFRGEVEKADDKHDNTFSYDKKERIKAIWVHKLKAFNMDKEKYSKKELEEKYNISINQTKQILASEEEYQKYLEDPKSIKKELPEEKVNQLELLCDLEKDYEIAKNNNKLYSLREIRNTFNEDILCECCELLKFSKKIAQGRTFKKTTGFVYYETHHLLMQNILSMSKDEWFKENPWFNKENENDRKMVLDEFNQINLCPVCHREFHYGDFKYDTSSDIKDKKQLIKALMNKHKFNQVLKQYGKTDDEIKQIKEYIINQYIDKKED